MLIKGIVDEDFVNYKKPSMFICTAYCSFKCDKESGVSCCQNSSLARQETLDIPDDRIIQRYISNPITKAIVIAGLEPFDQFDEVMSFIGKLRLVYHCNDTVIIYTGYYFEEITAKVNELRSFGRIIIKYGRFVPNQEMHYDKVLGVYLASPNQYAEEIS